MKKKKEYSTIPPTSLFSNSHFFNIYFLVGLKLCSTDTFWDSGASAGAGAGLGNF